MSLNAFSSSQDTVRHRRGRFHAGHRLGWAAVELERVKRVLDGRKLLMLDDIRYVVERITDAQAEIAKAASSETAEAQS